MKVIKAETLEQADDDKLVASGEAGEPFPPSSLPDSWRIVQLKEVANVQSGGTPPRKRPDFYGGTISWVKSLDLNEGIVLKTEELITQEGLISIRGKIRPVNTVMVAMYGGAGTVGKSGILGIPAATNQAVCCIEPKADELDPFYVLNYLIHTRRTWMRHAIGTRKDPNISKATVERTLIPLPPLHEQRTIAQALRTVQEAKEARQREVALLDEMFRALLDELMTGRRRTKGEKDA